MALGQLSITQKISALTISIIVILLIVLVSAIYIGQQRSLESSELRQLSTNNDIFWDQVDKDAKSLEKLLAVLTTNDDLVKTFVAADRDQVLAKAKPIFENLKKQFAITHFYFIDKNGVVFLRTHNPPQFGDKLTRATYLQAQDNGTLGKGIEMGAKYFSLRVVMPVRHNGEVVGYFELGQELDHFVNSFKKLTHSDISMWVNSDYAKSKNLTNVFENVDGWYRVMASDQKQQDALMHTAAAQLGAKASYRFTSSFAKTALSVQTFPYKDAFGNDAGVIMVANDVSLHAAEFSSFMYTIIGFSIVLLMIFLGITVWLARSITRPLRTANEMLRDISEGQGDLTVRLEVDSHDEVGELSENFNRFVGNLQQTISQVAASSKHVSAASEELTQSSRQNSNMVTRQRSETEQVATAVNEMAATVQEVARNASSAAEAADQADNEAAEGKHVVMKTIEAINNLASDVERSAQVISRLKNESQHIGTVLDVIKGIAEQTNLLALNAAIEAARAGEQGRGFAVVADEVRTLAQRTQHSTREIEKMIETLQTGANEAESVMQQSRENAQRTVTQAGQAGNSLASITNSVATIREMNTQIATAAEEQSSVASELNRSVTNIHQATSESAQQAAHMLDECSTLTKMGETLRQVVDRFRI